MDAITGARQKAIDSGAFDDETEAAKKPPVKAPPGLIDAKNAGEMTGLDLPSIAKSNDLPATKGKPIARKTGGVGMNPAGNAPMIGKPPPPVAPQPFGPMERIPEEQEPPSRTASMQGRPPSPAQAKSVGVKPGQKTQASPMAQPPPIPSAQRPAPTQASPAARPQPPPAFSSNPATFHQQPPSPQTQQFGSTVPLGNNQPSGPPQGLGLSEPFGSNLPPKMGGPPGGQPLNLSEPFASQPPQRPTGGNPFGSAPPPQYQGSAPPPPFGSSPPPNMSGSQPPIFGAYQSEPPAQPGYPQQPGFDPTGAPMPPPGQLGFAAPVLVDVTPRALVVETAGGYTDTIIPRNSKIPCERTRRFATGRDMQTTVRVRVAQGEHQFFPQNTYLGEVELSGLRPAPRGEVTVAVTFEVDADGTLRIRARDVQTGQEARAVLQLIGVADESSVVMMINRFAQQPVVGGGPVQ
jgi:molecular chaperone DnaK